MTSTTIITELPTETASDGTTIRSFQLSTPNDGGIVVVISTVGAAIQSVLVPNYAPDATAGTRDDVVLGFPTPKDMYESNNPAYMGVIVGRVANRIQGGTFTLNDTTYQLDINNGPNHLHGGIKGFSHQIWDATIDPTINAVVLSLHSPHGDQGYPASIQVTATYTLQALTNNNGAKLSLTMTAKLTPSIDNLLSTPINLAQHSYFNLGSNAKNTNILDNHTLELPSLYYTPNDEHSIPTGQVLPVPHSTLPRSISDAIREWHALSSDEMNAALAQLVPIGLDHNYVIHDNGIAGIVRCAETHRQLTVRTTTAPGVQVYTANWLNDCSGGKFANYKPWQGICLETQHYPNSINVEDNVTNKEFAKGKCVILVPGGEDYQHTVEYDFEPI